MIRNYIKIAWRSSQQQPLQTGMSLGGLALAIAAFLLIMLWVQNEWRFDTYHPAADRIYLITNQYQSNSNQSIKAENSPYPLAAALSSQLPQVELVAQMARSFRNEIVLQVGQNYFIQEYVAYVDQHWFEMFRYQLVEGSWQSFLAHPFSLILTRSKARQLFGNSSGTGRRVRIGTTDYIVRAIVQDNPVNSSFQIDVLIPFSAKLQTPNQRAEASTWLYPSHKTFIRLAPSANPAKVTMDIARLYATNRTNNDLTPSLLPLTSLHFQTDISVTAFDHTNPTTTHTFTLLAILLLLAAGVNYINLAIAKTTLRTKELGVRKMIGANRYQLFKQLMTESVLMSVFAMALSVLLIQLSLPAFNTFTGKAFTFDFTAWPIAVLLLGTWLVTLFLISIYPALLLSAITPIELLRGTGLFQIRNTTLRKLLIISRFSITVIMIIGVIVVYRQVTFLQQQHNDYQRSQLLTIQVPDEHLPSTSFDQFQANRRQLFSRLADLKQRLLALPSIKHVVRMNQESIVNGGYTTAGGVDWDGRDSAFQPPYVSYGADVDLQAIMKFRLVQGRWFNKEIQTDQANTILNETAVKQFGISQPVVGKRFNNGVIIGVVKDFYYQRAHEPIGPVVIRANLPNAAALLIETQPGQAVTGLKQALALFKTTFPQSPLVYAFADDEFEQLYRQDQKALQFMGLFSALCILISCMGLLGLSALSTQQRTKEIGVRRVLGASMTSLVALLSQDFLRLILVSIGLAFPIAWYAMNYWLKHFAYKITIDWWIFALAGVLALAIALLTIGLQSLKVARMNPVKSLRTE
ncbi:ABC transporter permease [Spirosoma pulveris]